MKNSSVEFRALAALPPVDQRKRNASEDEPGFGNIRSFLVCFPQDEVRWHALWEPRMLAFKNAERSGFRENEPPAVPR